MHSEPDVADDAEVQPDGPPALQLAGDVEAPLAQAAPKHSEHVADDMEGQPDGIPVAQRDVAEEAALGKAPLGEGAHGVTLSERREEVPSQCCCTRRPAAVVREIYF